MFDLPMAIVGRLGASIRGRGRRVPLAVVAGLLIASLIPVLIVALTPQPADISYEDLKAGRLPPLTTWLRVTGDLRPASAAGPYIYTLHDAKDDRLSVTVNSDTPLKIGPTQVTGKISGAISVPGSPPTIRADVPTEPGRHDPWLLFSLPAILAIVVVAGLRFGYPVIRRDPPARSRAVPLGPDESLAARWSGRIGGESVPRDGMRPCTITVATDLDVCQVIVTDTGSVRAVATRRASPRQRLRICRTDGCQPALAIHAPTADLVLAFDDGADRDRLAASLD